MTGLVRKTILLSAVGLMAAGAVWADVPNITNSTTPIGINVVGFVNPPDPNGTFTYIIRDALNNAIPNADVVIDFGQCTDIALCTTNTETNPPGGTFTCFGKRWIGTADGLGQVSFTIVGTGNGTGAARAVAACATVTVNSANFPALIVSAFDHDGTGGVAAPDLAIWRGDFLAQQGVPPVYRARSDYDKGGTVGSPDLSLWRGVFLFRQVPGQGSQSSCGDCP